MICPEDFFTPKSLETAYAKTLDADFVRQAIFTTLQQSLEEISPDNLGHVLDSSAGVFLHYFIQENAYEARVYDPRTQAVHRVDEWALATTGTLPLSLPRTDGQAASSDTRLGSRFVFIDQELWVLDSERLSNVNDSEYAVNRLAKLIQSLDGCSLCFPMRIYPSDLGNSMNIFAKNMVQRTAISEPIKKTLGRPKKVDRVAEAIKRQYPDGFGHQLQKQVLRTVKKDLNESIGMTTLRNAMAKITKEGSQLEPSK